MSTLYKYRTYCAQSLEIFIKREVYFAGTHQLNDPYDCKLSVRDSLRSAIDNADTRGSAALRERLERLQKIDHLYEKMEQDIAGVGVLSLSRAPTNVVMWAHYAENHKGFCVGFDFSEKLTTHVNDQQIVGSTDAYYCKDNPFADYFIEVANANPPPPWEEFWQTILATGMVAKGEMWSREEEVRIIKKSPGVVLFEPPELSWVIFGMNMADSHRRTLRTLLDAQEWRHIRFGEIRRTNGFAVELADA